MQFRLFGLLLIFAAGVLLQQRALPIMEGNDETWHFNYVTYLRINNRLPDRAGHTSNSTGQESGQPPLTYWVAASVFDLLNLPRYSGNLLADLDPVRNPWFTPPDWWNRKDNFNQYYHGDWSDSEKAFGHPDIVLMDRVARLLSLLYGLIAVLSAYGIAREIFASEAWALAATAFFAFTPQMLYMNAMLDNDASVTAFSTLAIWQTLILLRRGSTPMRLIIIGVLVALAALSKVSGLIIVPGIVLALLFDAYNRRIPLSRLIVNLGLVGGVVAVIFGPWVVYGLTTYHDPLGLGTHADPARDALPKPGVLQVLAELPSTYMSYWAKFGSSSIWLTPVVYVLCTLILVLSAWGYVRYARCHRIDWRSLAVQRGIVLAVIVIVALAALLYWLITLFPIAFAITGRLIYFAHSAVAVTVMGGLYLLAQRLSSTAERWLRAYSIGILMGAGLILAPITVWSSFSPPTLLTRDQLPALKGTPLEFEKMLKLLGYTYKTPFIHENSLYTVTLCWQVLKPTTRPAAFAIKIFGEVGDELGGRTSLLGMGHYPSSLWNTGDIFCDDVEIPIKGPLKPGQIDNVILIMFNSNDINQKWQAAAPDGTTFNFPLLYRAISQAGDMTVGSSIAWQPTTISFPGLADLKGYSIDNLPTPGSTLRLNLLWDVKAETLTDWSEFIHLIGPNTALSLGDGAPRNGLYPTWAWSRGEKVVDPWTLKLPANLPPGTYRVEVGFTDQTDDQSHGQRLAAVQDGAAVADNSPIVFSFDVKR